MSHLRITVIRPPTLVDKSSYSALICPPIGLAYINAVAASFASALFVVDAVGEFPSTRPISIGKRQFDLLGLMKEEICDRVPEDTDVLLLSAMFSSDWPYTRSLIASLRARCSKSIIIAGGEHITAIPEYSMQDCGELDLCVLGEGEAVLGEVLSFICKENKIPCHLPGTVTRKDNQLIRNSRKDRQKNIDAISTPRWQEFPLEKYFSGNHNFGVNLGRSMPILATRGCPFSCTFCSSPQMWTRLWQARSPASVISEIKEYRTNYHATNFDFYDLTAIIKREWIIEFCEALIAENLKITWQLPSGTRSEVIDKEVAELLVKAGCRNFVFAPESGSPRVLRDIKKRVDLKKMRQSMKVCVQAGISIKVNFVCGFPDERWSDFFHNLKFLAQIAWLGVDDASAYQFVPYPGSELFQKMCATNQVKIDDEYLENLSFYSCMHSAHSFNKNLSHRAIMWQKILVPVFFYSCSFLFRPYRILRTLSNLRNGREETRLDKILRSYIVRWS